MSDIHNDTYRDDLKAYVDRELPLLRRLAVREHLTHCASCREEILQMKQVTNSLRNTEMENPLDSALRARILGGAFADVQGPVFNAPRARRAQDRLLKFCFTASVLVNALFVTWVSHSDIFHSGTLIPPPRETQIKVFKRPPPPKPMPKVKPPPPPKEQPQVKPPPPLHVQQPPRPVEHVQQVHVVTSTRTASNIQMPPSPLAPFAPVVPAAPGPLTTPPAPPAPILPPAPPPAPPPVPAPHTEVALPLPAPPPPPLPPPPPVQPNNWSPIDVQSASFPEGIGSDVSTDGIDAGTITNGKVVISFTIDETGRARKARVKESSGNSDLDNRFLEAVKRGHGTPAIQDHIPRDQPYSLSFNVGG